ncbi:succinylglutamate desuccinylase/aspartoacylase family protein [Fastidiosibacter lacustris]|uniref:succinylglutamate desuccinylase/aspartoacylase family protein n=1 Tax=Fastidiosibacter lacustris TaxID=2056695 RepID=UPI000E34D621|nr:succinylglutamate desuccinylase/aspartoacylase family protein [Fastidiosibacter lacustris]
MKNTSFKICDVNVSPGEKATLALPLPEQYSCSPMYMPIKVINGQQKGECLLVFAMTDGNEFNGLEIVNQLFDDISANEIAGTLITIPVLNVYGLAHFPEFTPNGMKLSDWFPGDENGNFGERIAHVFTHEILKKVNYCIELQTGSLNHEILPQVYCNFDSKEARKLARAFQAPVITEVETKISSLRMTAENLNVPVLVYEAGEAMRFDQQAIQVGLVGVKNVMRTLKMLEGAVSESIALVFSKDDDWIISSSSGVLHSDVSLGESITKGEKIGRLSDPFSNENATIIKSDLDGVIVGINRSPLIQEGTSIFKVASFVDNEKAKAILEEWQETKFEGDG